MPNQMRQPTPADTCRIHRSDVFARAVDDEAADARKAQYDHDPAERSFRWEDQAEARPGRLIEECRRGEQHYAEQGRMEGHEPFHHAGAEPVLDGYPQPRPSVLNVGHGYWPKGFLATQRP